MAEQNKEKDKDFETAQHLPDIGQFHIEDSEFNNLINGYATLKKQLLLSLIDYYSSEDLSKEIIDDINDFDISSDEIVRYDNEAFKDWLGYTDVNVNINVSPIWNLSRSYIVKNTDDSNPLSAFIRSFDRSTAFNNALRTLTHVDENTKLGNWSVGKAINHLIDNAHNTPLGKCATYVKNAIAAGGKPYIPANAINMHTDGIIKQMGFEHIATLDNPQQGFAYSRNNANPGDVAIYDRPDHKHNYGHICMFTGERWISDFIQNTIWVYGGQSGQIFIYRHPS